MHGLFLVLLFCQEILNGQLNSFVSAAQQSSLTAVSHIYGYGIIYV